MRNGCFPALLVLALYPAAAAGVAWTSAMPPERFRQAVTVKVEFVPDSEIAARCKIPHPNSARLRACAKPDRTVVLPDPCPFGVAGEEFARLACHEKAHVLGWPGDHPE